MSKQSHTVRSLFHRIGVAGTARVRALQGTGAPSATLIALAALCLACLAPGVASAVAAADLSGTPAPPHFPAVDSSPPGTIS